MSPRLRRWVIRTLSPVFRGLYRLFGGFRAAGLEHVPATGPAILAPNHLSWADPPAIRIAIDRTCWFMANDWLFRIPILGWVIRFFGAFPVVRGKLDRDAIRIAEQHLKEGDLVCIFPEGGTSLTGRLVPLEGGIALLSLRSGATIIPCAITSTDKLLPPSAPYPHYVRGGVSVTFGPPLHPAEADPALGRKERVEILTRRLYQAIASMLPPEYLPEPGCGANPPTG